MKPFKRKISTVLIAVLVLTSLPTMSYAAVYDDTADDIKYSVSSNKVVNFSANDFNDVCDDLTDEDLDYVKFKLPDEEEGILYYDYDADEKSNTEVSSSRKYSLDKSPYLKRVTFVPDKDFSGTVTIRYTGYNEDGDSYSGKIKITVKAGSSSSKNAISYTMSYKSDYVKFNAKDFLKVCKTIQSRDLDYVKFSLPDKSDGILYYDYDDKRSEKVSTSRKYYYDDSSYQLSKISFVPDNSFSGTLTIKYTGYDVKGDSYEGKVTITVGEDEDNTKKRISYTAKNSNSAIKFNEDDFNDLCDDLNGRDLDYVKFTIPASSRGVLYYNYSNGQYSSVVTSSKKYYMESSPYLGDVTFLPKDQYSGTFAISFEGWDVKGNSFTGEIAITVGNGSGSGSSSSKAITYSGKANTPTLMKDSDFNSICKELLGNQLSYVTFSLPSESYGDLYYGYTQDGDYSAKVREGTKYYFDGSPYLLNVAFVPARSFSGTATISYTGYDIVGLSYNGTVQVSTSSNSGTVTTPVETPVNTPVLVSSKYFGDVDTSYSWAVPYIDSLYESKIISGSTSGSSKLYSPATNVTRGDFMLLLYRALDMKTTSKTTGFSDVPSGSYYYTAINTAKALGIAQGSDNFFYPDIPITREDAMVFVQRAVNIVGKTIPSGDTESLKSFRDYNAISDYSRSAVAALVKASIITGSDDNMVYPQGGLSRAQVAAIIHRVINR